jgi:hypothetical protein
MVILPEKVAPEGTAAKRAVFAVEVDNSTVVAPPEEYLAFVPKVIVPETLMVFPNVTPTVLLILML